MRAVDGGSIAGGLFVGIVAGSIAAAVVAPLLFIPVALAGFILVQVR